MDASEDPINQFFPLPIEDNILYTTLGVVVAATASEITKAYRKLALIHHPDKHSAASETKRKAEEAKFQQVGFAYGVLRDEARRKRYDATGLTGEASFVEQGEEMGWEAYFESIFQEVTRAKLDEMKLAYQGSDEERIDVVKAYDLHDGSLPDILSEIMFSSPEDEPRLIELVQAAIKAGDLKETKLWKLSSKDEKAKKKRKRESEKEANEAEEAAKEMGVWEEFYGDGKKGARRGKGKGAKKDDEEDTSALQALIQRNAAKRSDGPSFLEEMERKYATPAASKGGKKGGKKKQKEEMVEALPGEIDDETFAKIQAEMEAKRVKKAKAK